VSRRWIMVLIAIALPLLGYFALWVIASSQGGPLSGRTTHDFGVVRLTEADTTVTHRYRLTNDTEGPISIRAIRPECGCVQAARGEIIIAPGAVGEIPITVHPPIGPKSVLIHLDLGTLGTQTLKMEVEGQPVSRLSVAIPVAILIEAPTTVVIRAEMYESADEPGPLSVSGDRPIQSKFSGWSLMAPSQNPKTMPTQWEGLLTIEQTAELAAASAITLSVPGVAPLIVPVNAAANSQPENPLATVPADH